MTFILYFTVLTSLFYRSKVIILQIMGKIGIDVRKLVIIKLQDGWLQRKIAADLNISRHGVPLIITKFNVHNKVTDLFRRGRPRLNTVRSEGSLIRTAKRYPKKTGWNSSKPTSINTLKRILKKYA